MLMVYECLDSSFAAQFLLSSKNDNFIEEKDVTCSQEVEETAEGDSQQYYILKETLALQAVLIIHKG